MELPKFVSLDGCEMRLKDSQYWRDAGNWGVDYKIIDGKLLSWHWRLGHDWLHRVELIPITEEEWRKGNKGYV
jgi:hypothetical protein